MESPVKKLDLSAGKENAPIDAEVVESKPTVPESTVEVTKGGVAPTIKPEEADEPILRENPSRFVLFPIKYHEVSNASFTRKVAPRRDPKLTPQLDLANVQEARGFFLDS